jgi:hypothetical protein
MRILRNIFAVICGYAVFAVSAVLLFQLSGIDPHADPSVLILLLVLAYGTVFSFLGGVVTQWISRTGGLTISLVLVGQQPGMHKGTEAQINLELLGGKDHAYRLMESDYVMSSSGVIRPSLYGKWALRMKGDAIKRKIKRMIIKVVMPLKRIIRK